MPEACASERKRVKCGEAVCSFDESVLQALETGDHGKIKDHFSKPELLESIFYDGAEKSLHSLNGF